MKRTISLLLTLVMCLSLCSCGRKEALAASKGLAYTSNEDGTCYVSGIGTCTDTDLVIPAISPSGDRVTSIGEKAFFNCEKLTSITIPGGVTSIGYAAFAYCDGLTNIIIPNGVTSIDEAAFIYCANLTKVTIPDSLTKIGVDAFCCCYKLSSIQFSGTKDQWHAISKGDSWDFKTDDSCIIDCTDGEIRKATWWD